MSKHDHGMNMIKRIERRMVDEPFQMDSTLENLPAISSETILVIFLAKASPVYRGGYLVPFQRAMLIT